METALGRSILRHDDMPKLLGTAQYIDDLPRDGVWVGGTVRTHSPHGRVKRLEYNAGCDWRHVVVVTAQDIPAVNALSSHPQDQPVLVETTFRHCDEPVVLIAAPDQATLQQALAATHVVTTAFPPVLDLEAALAGPVYGSDNILRDITITRGDISLALRTAATILERTYTTAAQEHAYLEPQGMEAVWEDDHVTVRGSMQCPYYIAEGLACVLGLPLAQIRVQQCVTGGGLGGKEEYPTLLAAHAALLARKAGRPVRMVYERQEDMRCTTKRHPARVHHRTAWAADGKLLGMDIDVVLDGGAYPTLSPVVLARAAIHAAGPYQCEHVTIRARAVATHYPPRGAFRGFGAPQTLFALEDHVDFCAAQLGLEAMEVRRLNLLRPGGTLATGQQVGADTAVVEVLQEAVTASRFAERHAAFAGWNREAPSRTGAARYTRRGIGLAVVMHGAGFAGHGERLLQSAVTLRGNPDGTVSVLTAQCEFGQGTETILAQAAAAGLGYPLAGVTMETPDTAIVPNSGPTVASRTAMIIGGLVLEAGQRLRQHVEQHLGRADIDAAALRAGVAELSRQQPLTVTLCYQPPADLQWDEATFRGDAYSAYAWGCCVAAVEVDILTGEVRVLDVTAVQDAGQVFNPLLAAGQARGGITQRLGWALLENVVWENGTMQNATLTGYTMPTTLDTPPIHVVFLTHPNPTAPTAPKALEKCPLKVQPRQSSMRWPTPWGTFARMSLSRLRTCVPLQSFCAALAGNLCRCTGYEAIITALQHDLPGT